MGLIVRSFSDLNLLHNRMVGKWTPSKSNLVT